MVKNKVDIPKETLYDLYINQEMSMTKIGKIYGVTETTISRYIKQYNIPIYKYRGKNLKGKKYGKLLVLKRAKKNEQILGRSCFWVCLCDCGTKCTVETSYLTRNKRESCKKCKKQEYCKSITSHPIIPGTLFSNIKWGAKVRNLKLDVTIEDLGELFKKQNCRCALSGTILTFAPIGDRKNNSKQTASLDRIDNNKGYTKDNIQWIHKDINRMKHTLDQEYFLDLCSKIHNNNNPIFGV